MNVVFERYLGAILEAAGFEVTTNMAIAGRPRGDMVASDGEDTYVFELKAVHVVRRLELRAMLASAILEASASARDSHASPIAVIAVPRFTSSTIEELKGYARLVAPDVPLVLLSYEAPPLVFGDAKLKRAIAAAPVLRAEEDRYVRAARPRLFSDLNAWMLKVLLAPRLHEGLLSAPRDSMTRSIELAGAAGVSQPSAWRFLRALKQESYLRVTPYYEVQQAAELLQRWSESQPRPREIRAVWLLPTGNDLAQLREALGRTHQDRGHRMCLALFAACAELGLGYAQGAVPHVYLEDATDMAQLGLAAANPGEQPHVIIWCASNPESVFRGSVRPASVPTADVLQCWLDSRRHRARGREQADYLWRTVLSHLEKLD